MALCLPDTARTTRIGPAWRMAAAGAFLAASAATAHAQQQAPAPPEDVTFYGNPSGTISAGVVIPANRASVWISGTTPPAINPDAPAGSRERFGDTKTQATGILQSIEKQLAALGLTMKDVVYVRAYLVPDPAMEGRLDTAGWNAAYREVFGTDTNPTKTARSTVGVAALVGAGWLVELEAFAVYPASKP